MVCRVYKAKFSQFSPNFAIKSDIMDARSVRIHGAWGPTQSGPDLLPPTFTIGS
jgi:hypothetical protein